MSSLPRPARIVLSMAAGALLCVALVSGGWLGIYHLWQSSHSLKENVAALSMIPFVGLVIFIPHLFVLAVSLGLGVLATVLLWPKRAVPVAPLVRTFSADAVAEALGQYRRGVKVTAKCPGCGAVIAVENSVAQGPGAKLYLRCVCGACSGQVPA